MTQFYLIRHGEPDWEINELYPDLTFQYDSLERLTELGNDYDANHGVYPPGGTRPWESKEMLKNRVEKVVDQYLGFQKVIITGHGMAIRTLIGEAAETPHASISEYTKTGSPLKSKLFSKVHH